MNTTTDNVIHEPENNRFVVYFDDGQGEDNRGELVYQRQGNTLHLIHSEVPASRKGQGLGGRLMNAALAEIEMHNLKVQPVCRYTDYFIQRNKRWHALRA
jgi:predicted GNAT family acetyltransferase